MSTQVTPAERYEPMSSTQKTSDSREDTDRLRTLETGVVGLLTIQLVIGYEWLVSGVTKLWRGGFAAGLSAELRAKSPGASAWYRSFLDNIVIPHGWAFGWIVLAAEIAVGITLLGTAVVFLARRHRLRLSTRQLLLALIALASVSGILMNISFHLANGNPHPWLIPHSGFDEGVDLDSLMPLVQLAFVVVAARVFMLDRKTQRTAVTEQAGGAS